MLPIRHIHRSRRIGLLTDEEQRFLRGESSFSRKHEWDFMHSLSSRIKATISDYDLLINTKIDDKVLDGWLASNWLDIYNFKSALDLNPNRHLRFGQIFRGKIKFVLQNKGLRNARLYWFDSSDDSGTEYDRIFQLDHRLRGIEGKNVRPILRKAFETESKYNNQFYAQLSIIPRSEEQAIPIREIKEGISKAETRLQFPKSAR